MPSISTAATTAVAAGSNRKTKTDKVQVAVRMRPLNTREQSGKAWQVNTHENTIKQINADGVHGDVCDVYGYGHTFDEHSSTKKVYDRVGKPIVSDVLQGYHGTICTYGQTASGKTYTMQGCGDGDGIIQMAASDIFIYVDQQKHRREFVVKVSFIEIYNEDVRDLLAVSGKDCTLKVRENEKKIFFVNSIERTVTNMNELLSELSAGEKNRSVGATKMNDNSSRSHSMVRITVESRSKNEEGGSTAISTLNLVDLAGSECVRQTGATGDRQKEVGKINKSLLALNMVIMSLGQKGTAVSAVDNNIPYRDSNLTKILKHSLSGNAKMAVVCCATPSERHLKETRSTLQYANEWQLIKTKAKKSRPSIMGTPSSRKSHGRSNRRSSMMATPLKKMSSEEVSFLSPKRSSTPISKSKLRHPQTDARPNRPKRTSIISSSIPEHDEVDQLRKTLTKKNAKIASLGVELQSTKDELQATADRLQEEIDWLQSQNQELRSQVDTLKADKEFLDAEEQARSHDRDQLIVKSPEEEHRYLMAPPYMCYTDKKRKRADPSFADSYYGIVAAFGKGEANVCERLVEALEREDQAMKCTMTLSEDTVETSCQTSTIGTDETSCKISIMDSTADEKVSDSEIVCYSGGGDLILFDETPNVDTIEVPGDSRGAISYYEALTGKLPEPPSPRQNMIPISRADEVMTMKNDNIALEETSEETAVSNGSSVVAHNKEPSNREAENTTPDTAILENEDAVTDENNTAPYSSPAKVPPSSSKKRTLTRTPLGKATRHNIQSPAVTKQGSRARKKTKRYSPNSKQLVSMASLSSEAEILPDDKRQRM